MAAQSPERSMEGTCNAYDLRPSASLPGSGEDSDHKSDQLADILKATQRHFINWYEQRPAEAPCGNTSFLRNSVSCITWWSISKPDSQSRKMNERDRSHPQGQPDPW